MAIKDVIQLGKKSCGYYAGYAVSVVNAAGGFSPDLPMTREAVEKARKEYTNPDAYLLPSAAPDYLKRILKVKSPYRQSFTNTIKPEKVRACLEGGKALMLGDQEHWIALVAMENPKKIKIYNPGPKNGHIIDTMSLDKLNYGVYLVHPIHW